MKRPNVLLICFDHWPGQLIGARGHSRIMTPTLNHLAANGVMFTEAYTTTPTCIPARRALMTGTSARTHGDRVFNEHLEMDPKLPTMPQLFRNAGYQAYAVGKLHVYPQRDRIGFDDVILCEEGRRHLSGLVDDYEQFLKDEGFAGQELTHAMGNNRYGVRPWHLPERLHPTNWTTRRMCQEIRRRDPTRPGFWYCSYITPHPPITPPRDYMDLYQSIGVDEPVVAPWAEDFDRLPYALKKHRANWLDLNPLETRQARIGFYAQCTYIDHQVALLIGTLREEGLLDDTIVMVVSDHGDMLGNHRFWAKPPMFEWSAKIPMILVPTASYDRVGHRQQDDRLAALRDVAPTLLDLCDVPIPETMEGNSLIGDHRRDSLYCEHHEGPQAMRMIRAGDHKLIWYPVGNRFQLFDVIGDPMEMNDLADSPSHAQVRADLTQLLTEELYGSDLEWVKNGTIVGEPDRPFEIPTNRGLSGQRGWR